MSKLTIFVISSAVLLSCSQHAETGQKEAASEEVSEINMASLKKETATASENDFFVPLSSAAALPGLQDSLHRFVRTADLRFRAKDVISTSLAIEKLFTDRAGYIERSRIYNEEKEVHTARRDAHSEWKITRFTTVSTITARIPSARLNDVLTAIQPFVDYLDHRTVDARNIAFDSYLKKLVQQRITAHAARFLKAKSPDEANALDQLLEREMQSDREKVDDLRLDDQVAYSTVTLSIYGQDNISRQQIPLISMDGYEPGFGTQLANSLSFGWKLVVLFVLLLVRIWPLLLIGGIIWWWLKRRRLQKAAAHKLTKE